MFTALSVAILLMLAVPSGRETLRGLGESTSQWWTNLSPARSDQEAYIRARVAQHLREAIDSSTPLTRDTAVRIASRQQGEFKVEQVAAIWQFVREHWRYVNDPNGREYFARASETIRNEFAGDCDDFAITLAAMVEAIGGRARVVFMDGPRGGHAYSEVCIQQQPTQVATELAGYYGSRWLRYTTGATPGRIAFRQSTDCPVWLNLDWNANVPGGEYANEQWTVAIYSTGQTETLATAGGPASPRARAGSAPNHVPTPSAPARP